MTRGPRRIVCLTEEPTEVLYALGEQDRIVGISGFTVRPPVARREKPKVSAVTSAKIGEILVIASGENFHLIRVVDSRAEPVDETTAAPRIEQFLLNRRSREALAKDMKQIKAQSKIEYVGEFASDAAAAQAKANAESETAATTSESPAVARRFEVTRSMLRACSGSTAYVGRLPP